jgi:zinc transporter ZupT
MDVQSLHNVLITLHAATAAISFFAGCLLILSLRQASNQRLFSLYLWSLVGMVILLIGAMLVYWNDYSDTERIVFPVLLGLGMFMLYRAQNASRLLKARQNDWKLGYVEHIGFTLISLFEGFVIVTVLNTGGPGWLVALLAILGVLVGRWAIGLTQRNVLS